MSPSFWRFAACMAFAIASAAVAGEPPAQKVKTVRLGEWYTVTCPETLPIGGEAEIKVAYRGIAEKTTLCCDLHYQKTDGTGGGFYSNDWRPKPPCKAMAKSSFTSRCTRRRTSRAS